MKITFIGHASFIIEGDSKIIIDPFITNNPMAKIDAADLKADLVLVSHGHWDHMGDAIQIAKNSNCTMVAVNELANYFGRHGARAHGMHIGGGYNFDNVRIKLTPAWHGSGFAEEGPAEYLGNPCGFIIKMNGKTIYHAGDTGLFGDMELIGRLNPIDLALLPIGDNFTMGPEDALEAVRLLKPKVVVPMHYDTWPVIAQDPEEFKKNVESATTARVEVLYPGNWYEI